MLVRILEGSSHVKCTDEGGIISFFSQDTIGLVVEENVSPRNQNFFTIMVGETLYEVLESDVEVL